MDKGLLIVGVLLLLSGLIGAVKHADAEWLLLLLGGIALTVVAARK